MFKRTLNQKIIYGIFLVIFTYPLFFGGFSVYILGHMQNFDNTQIILNNSSVPLNDTFNTVGYDLITKTELISEADKTISGYPSEPIVAPFLGNTSLQGDLQISYPFPPDDRTKILDTSIYPWSTICKLYITAADSTQFIGSGAMLDEYHILTCGHCVYIHDHGGWASEVKVVPGKAGSYEPFGHAFATYYRSYSGWTDDEMYQHDWAVVTLDRTIGNLTGWMGRRTADYEDPIYTGVLNIAGYPGDLDSGEYMYFDADNGSYADEYNHWYWMDMSAGQSGSPVWHFDGENRYILTINAYEYESGIYPNFGTRLDQDKYDRIITWLSQDSPPDGNGNNNGQYTPDLIFLIPVFIAIGVVVVVVAVIIILAKRSRPDLEIFERSGEVSTYFASESEIKPQQDQYNQYFPKFCPMCGKRIVRSTQKFCINCGFELQNPLNE
ncbi:MAG: zinc-ribbon domain-containing protein [Promethearchaeota archaeon]|nr:MAG: zinc-ribbon domain-containing protein [Candidatus Lokiarchaeota archaeon]